MNVECAGGPIIGLREPVEIGRVTKQESRNKLPDEKTRQYFLARERAERAAAKRATSFQARCVHQELAQTYSRLARADEGPV